MMLGGHLIPWAASWHAHELAHDLPRGRIEVDAAWLRSWYPRVARALGEAWSLAQWSVGESEFQYVRGLLDGGTMMVFGFYVRMAHEVEPPIRYVPARDRLLFGASA